MYIVAVIAIFLKIRMRKWNISIHTNIVYHFQGFYPSFYHLYLNVSTKLVIVIKTKLAFFLIVSW